MQTVGAYEAKTHLSRLLAQVASGESITITKHGVPVAVLSPPPAMRRPDVGAVIDAILEFQKTVEPLGELTIRGLIEEGRQ